MRIANVAGRAKLWIGGHAVDVATASADRFGPGLTTIYDEWAEFRRWAADFSAGKNPPDAATEPFSPTQAGPPSPAPKQVFAIALNYSDHAKESGTAVPDDPLVF